MVSRVRCKWRACHSRSVSILRPICSSRLASAFFCGVRHQWDEESLLETEGQSDSDGEAESGDLVLF